MSRTRDILDEVLFERERQERLKDDGRFDYTLATNDLTYSDKLAVMQREMGEVAHTVYVPGDRRESLLSQQTKQRLREELIQVAACAVAWAESLEE
jgi:heme exporter protein D